MIAIDTSAVIAILQDEPTADACKKAIEDADALVISAGTLSELLIVAGRRGIREQADHFVRDLAIEVASVTAPTALEVAAAYDAWGKGSHPAGLNLGDCFAYALAKSRNCSLLFVGNDFIKTDVENAAD